MHVAVLFGGKSAEHDVSILSAWNVIRALDKQKYDLSYIKIDKQGVWRLLELPNLNLQAPAPPGEFSAAGQGRLITLSPESATVVDVAGLNQSAPPIDVVFPVLHGPFGEDGTLQGMLELAGIPYAGSGVLASAAAMDKDVAKRLLRDAGIPVVPFRVLTRNHLATYEDVAQELGDVLFVKPARLGSSVGVGKARNAAEFERALGEAFRFDHKVLVEKSIQARELECAVLGSDAPLCSVVGEVMPTHEFYSYEAKYLDSAGAEFAVPAALEPSVATQIRAYSADAFRALGCEGMARVDFFLSGANEIFLNEVNTIPGFTNISMYPRLWAATDLPTPVLLDRLIDLAVTRFEQNKTLTSHM